MLRLLDAAIFNVIVGNADAHGKNFSLLYGSQGVELAPLYDLMCAAAYPDVHAKMAMKVAGRATLEAFTPSTWEDFGRDIGMGPPFVRRRAAALAELALRALPDAADGIADAGFDGPDLRRIQDVIRRRAQRVRDKITLVGPTVSVNESPLIT